MDKLSSISSSGTLRLFKHELDTSKRNNCDVMVDAVISELNRSLESFMGISDNELSNQIWSIGQLKLNPSEFITAINSCDLSIFNFNQEFLFDLWGIISDAKSGRYPSKFCKASTKAK